MYDNVGECKRQCKRLACYPRTGVEPGSVVLPGRAAAAAALAATPAEFDVLARVDAFLRDGGSSRPFVPHRERSLEVFGNEKRLDTLIRTRLFTKGALTLDLLRCFQAPLPLTAQYVGRPCPRGDPHDLLLAAVDHHIPPADRQAMREIVAKGDLAVFIQVDDLDKTFESLRAAGAEILQEPVDQAYGVRDAAVRDPSGNHLRLSQPLAAQG